MIRVALVGPEIEENLSLRYLASSLARAGCEVELVAFNHEAAFGSALARVLAYAPDLVGLSLAFQWRAMDFLALATALRASGYRGHITAGGHFATFEAKAILSDFPEIDSICLQEAEETIVSLALAVGAREALHVIPGLALNGTEIVMTGHATLPDLATLPRPDRRGEPAACFGHGIAPLVSSRGCYANCSFCCIAAWHEQSLPGTRYRLREVGDVADEMIEMQRTRGIEIFVFHDDNFFVPGHKKNLERFNALANALEARGMQKFATVVKARPTDVDREVFGVLKHRLNCIRAYIGIETDADQGLKTLRRWAKSNQNHDAVQIVRELDLYTCYNVLLFDPDTTLDSIQINLDFLRSAPELPSNFGRVELYAGTPLLGRMLEEGRATGDYLQWDYSLGSPEVERVFRLAMECFYERNFGEEALANRIMGTRFDIEVVKFFHPHVMRAEWKLEGEALSRILALSGVEVMEQILNFVRRGGDDDDERALVREASAKLRAAETEVRRRGSALAKEMQRHVGGRPLTELGDKVATPLQTQRSAR